MKNSTKLTAGALSALLAFAVTGCSSVEVSPPIDSCENYRVNSAYGNFSIQQYSRGSALQWGAYPNANYSGTRYAVNVVVNGRRYDAKDQAYPPHGSVDSSTATKNSGNILQISGNVTKGEDTVLRFNMQCRIM